MSTNCPQFVCRRATRISYYELYSKQNWSAQTVCYPVGTTGRQCRRIVPNSLAHSSKHQLLRAILKRDWSLKRFATQLGTTGRQCRRIVPNSLAVEQHASATTSYTRSKHWSLKRLRYPVGDNWATMSTNCPQFVGARTRITTTSDIEQDFAQRCANQLGQLGNYVDELSQLGTMSGQDPLCSAVATNTPSQPAACRARTSSRPRTPPPPIKRS